jgi:acetyltransferase
MLEAFFKPRSVAVIGASREPGKVGHEVLKNILKSGYDGKIFPVNPNASEILGLKCYQNILQVPDFVDLGVVAVPAAFVLQVARDAAVKGLKGLIVISAGFKESGVEGAKAEIELLEICKRGGIRLIGPNCLGVIDTATPLNASFTPNMPRRGNIAFISQSGALGTAILDWAITEGIGFSKFMSLGNKADVNEADILEILGEDEETKVILLYVEGVIDGGRFLKAAREVVNKKPIIALKAGASEAGARAVSSHTGALAGSEIVFNVAFNHAGILRVETTEELFDLAEAFSKQPIPKGPSVAIVTNAGGPGILATDACEKYGLKLNSLAQNTVAKLRGGLPPAASFFNPVDILGDATALRYRFALETVLESPEVDSLLVILTPQAMTEPVATAKEIINMARKFPHKPVIASFIGGEAVKEAIKILEAEHIPCYPFPERASKALSSLVRYGELRIHEAEEPTSLYVNKEKAGLVIKLARESERVTLLASEASQIATAYGIPTPIIELAMTAEEAVLAAERIGYPVALKIESPQIMHKTDIGGVKLNINSAEEVRQSFYELVGRAHIFYPTATIIGVNVQKMVPSGKEVIIGMTKDNTFGPLIMFGLGGIYVNFLRDVAFRLAPLSRKAAEEMIQETKAYTLLRGIRGEAISDIESVLNVLLRVSALVTDFQEINELDINPLFVYDKGKGSMALDIKIVIKP